MKLNSTMAIEVAVLCLLAASTASYAQIDTIRLKEKRLNTASLKPGMRQYLVYSQSSAAPHVLGFSLWQRNTQIQDRNGEKVFVTIQHWYGTDTLNYRVVYSVNRVSDFSPVYHSETVQGKNRSYNWNATNIKGADTLKVPNMQKDFAMDFTTPNFNWNLDIETFEMLPLEADKKFAINFYDAGSGKPQYVIYKVTGSEVIATVDNQKADCWKLHTESEHNGQKAVQTFWITKKSHEFLKEEDSYAGNHRYKVKLPGTAYHKLKGF